MLKPVIAAFIVSSLSVVAFAAEPERVEHYHVEQPKTMEEAKKLLDVKIKEIDAVLKVDTLNDGDLEAIHRVSYSLEAAVDSLRQNQTAELEPKLDELDEAVQALHYASENHEEAKVRNWFSKLKISNLEVRNAL